MVTCQTVRAQLQLNPNSENSDPTLTVMESDLSSSDGALRMLLVEDVELPDRGILMSSGPS